MPTNALITVVFCFRSTIKYSAVKEIQSFREKLQFRFTIIRLLGYKGKFNICAFLFGPLWALTKPTALIGLIALIASFLTSGLGGIIACIYFGFRGNYMCYKICKSSIKMDMWRKITDLNN